MDDIVFPISMTKTKNTGMGSCLKCVSMSSSVFYCFILIFLNHQKIFFFTHLLE